MIEEQAHKIEIHVCFVFFLRLPEEVERYLFIKLLPFTLFIFFMILWKKELQPNQ